MSNPGFKDNFSIQAKTYAKFRPKYPDELFEFIAGLCPEKALAWDCGTGNGQSAVSLAQYFAQVIATDPSAEQIKNAELHDRVLYKIEKAEEPSITDNSVDLITVAQAIHWFDFDVFYAAAKRVLKPEGIIAAWAYGIPGNPEIDEQIKYLHFDVLDEFWQPENRMIEKEYTTIPFPFKEINHRQFYIQKRISMHELVGHFQSWSAVQRYRQKHGVDPLEDFVPKLQLAWGDPETLKEITWKLTLKVGRNNQ